MKRFLRTAVIIAALSAPVFAESCRGACLDNQVTAASDLYASELIATLVSGAEAEMDGSACVTEENRDEWDDIGEIDDVIVTREADVAAVIAGVGGFLGIVERPVAVTFDELTILRNGGGDSFRVYIDATQVALERQPEYEG